MLLVTDKNCTILKEMLSYNSKFYENYYSLLGKIEL